MNIILGFVGTLLAFALLGGLIYAIVKKKLALGISLVVGILVIGGLWWGLSGTPSTPSASGTWSQTLQAPSPKTVWENTKNYWLWIVLILGLSFFVLYAIEKPWAKALQWFLATMAVMLFAAIPLVDRVRGEKQQSEKMTLSMAPNGKSQYVPVPQGKHVVMDGEDFRYHCVYGDGHEESFGKGETRCSDGHVPFVYATNKREKEANVVTYSYAQR
jgi:hypothetical protein